MSGVLNGSSNGNPLNTVIGAESDAVSNGLNYSNGSLIVTNDFPTHYHQGLGFNDDGAVCIGGGPVTHMQSGAAPMNAMNQLVVSAGPTDHFAHGMPYDAEGALVVTDIGSAISYLMDLISTPTRYLTNSGSAGSEFNAEVFSGNIVKMNGTTQSVDLDIVHQLGSELVTQTLPISLTSQAGASVLNDASSLNIGDSVHIEFSVTSYTSGKIAVTATGTGTVETPYVTAVGTYSYDIVIAAGFTGDFALYGDFANPFTGTIDSFSIKEITNNNSYVTVFDPVLEAHKTIANSNDVGSSSVEIDISDIVHSANGGIFTDNGDGTYTVIGGTSSTGSGVRGVIPDTDINTTYNFKADKLSGSLYLSAYTTAFALIATGQDEITFTTTTDDTLLYISAGSGTIPVVYENPVLKEVLPASTTYTQTESFNNFIASTAPPNLAYLNSQPESAFRIKNGTPLSGDVAGLGLTAEQIEHHYIGNEGEAGGKWLQDTAVPLGAEGVNDPSFASGNLSDWAIAGDSGASSITISNNEMVFDYVATDAAFLNIKQNGITPAGTPTLVEIHVESITGAIKIQDGVSDTSYGLITTAGIHTFVDIPESVSLVVARNNSAVDTNAVISYISAKEVTAAEIQNYTESCRTDLANQSIGFQNVLVEQDGTGRAIDIADPGTLVGGADGRHILFPITPPVDHLFTKSAKDIAGDEDSLLITHTDDTTTTIP